MNFSFSIPEHKKAGPSFRAAKCLCLLIFIACTISYADWPMAAANPERTSWTSDEPSGDLAPIWYCPVEPYIPQKVQLVCAGGMVFTSTSRGLYAMDANTGTLKWVYPTHMPLGHSPTISNNVAYVGCFDRMIHAVNITTGQKVWTSPPAGAGFQTNPLVVENKVIAGCRDGYLYAYSVTTGTEAWKFKTDGPILFSPAYKDGVVYLASNDSYAYAVNAGNGSLVWKSAKLLGTGFHSWWPVVYQDKVILAGSRNYRGGSASLNFEERIYTLEQREVFGRIPANEELFGIELSGGWRDFKIVADYLDAKPWRRTFFVLDRTTGQETKTIPAMWCGTHGGNRYPPIVSGAGELLVEIPFIGFQEFVTRSGLLAWKVGTNEVKHIGCSYASDEPFAASAGGNLILHSLCCERVASTFGIGSGVNGGMLFCNYCGDDADKLHILTPGYNETGEYYAECGIYGDHGDQNPPVPYGDKVFIHRMNCVLALGKSSGTASKLSNATTVQAATPGPLSIQDLSSRLSMEVEKMINTGHLRTAYLPGGIYDEFCGSFSEGNTYKHGYYLNDYFHNPAFTVQVLIRALPHLSVPLQEQLKTYIKSEFESFPPYRYSHVGFKQGSAREAFILPPEVEDDIADSEASGGMRPENAYAIWKYAQEFGGAGELLSEVQKAWFSQWSQGITPSNSFLQEYPHEHNAWIAGYVGYLELMKLAGRAEDAGLRTELTRLLTMRAGRNFSEPMDYPSDWNFTRWQYQNMNVSRNFMYLVPELAQYLHDHSLSNVAQAWAKWNDLGAYWSVSNVEDMIGEGVRSPLYNTHGMFQARAQILKVPYEELAKFIDVPGCAVGDIYYIDNLVAALEAADPNPHFVGPLTMSIGADKPFGRRLQYVLPQGGTPALDFQRKPSWVNVAMGDSIYGIAPGTIGQVDTMTVVLLVNSIPQDTMHTIITMVDPTGVRGKPEKGGLVLQWKHNGPKNLEVYDIAGRLLSENSYQDIRMRSTSIGFVRFHDGKGEHMRKIVLIR